MRARSSPLEPQGPVKVVGMILKPAASRTWAAFRELSRSMASRGWAVMA